MVKIQVTVSAIISVSPQRQALLSEGHDEEFNALQEEIRIALRADRADLIDVNDEKP